MFCFPRFKSVGPNSIPIAFWLVIILAVIPSRFYGQSVTAQAGNWSDKSTWQQNRPKNKNDNVEIRHTVTFNGQRGGGKVGGITFNNNGTGTPKLIIQAGKTLEVYGNLDASNGTLEINGSLKLQGNNSHLKNFRKGDFSGPVTFPGGSPAGDSLVFPMQNQKTKLAVALGNVPSGQGFTVSKTVNNPKSRFSTNLSASLNDISNAEFFQVSPNNNLSQKVRITLFWDTSRQTNFGQINNKANLVVAHYNSTANQWENYGNSGVGGTLNGKGYITSRPTNNFSPFTFGSGGQGGALPVDLTYFEASFTNETGKVNLAWKTATETNNSHFLIQRRWDTGSFRTIGRKKGRGTTVEPHTYRFNDFSKRTGTLYYRLKQVDYDGTYEYSDVEAVNLRKSSSNGPLAIQTVWPNPFTDVLRIQLHGLHQSGKGEVRLRSVSGHLVKQKTFISDATNERISLENLGGLPAGTYGLRVKTRDGLVTKTVLKQ